MTMHRHGDASNVYSIIEGGRLSVALRAVQSGMTPATPPAVTAADQARAVVRAITRRFGLEADAHWFGEDYGVLVAVYEGDEWSLLSADVIAWFLAARPEGTYEDLARYATTHPRTLAMWCDRDV